MHKQLDKNCSIEEDNLNQISSSNTSSHTAEQSGSGYFTDESCVAEKITNDGSKVTKALFESYTTDAIHNQTTVEPSKNGQHTAEPLLNEPLVTEKSSANPLKDDTLTAKKSIVDKEVPLQENDNSIDETISMCFKFLADNSQLAKLYYTIGSKICDVTQWYKLRCLDLRNQDISKLSYFDISFPMLEILNM